MSDCDAWRNGTGTDIQCYIILYLNHSYMIQAVPRKQK